MANLEVGIGANSSEFDSEIQKVERKLQRLESQRAIEIQIGGDTSDLDRRLERTRTRLDSLRSSVGSMGQAMQQSTRSVGNASNTLTNFSRIAQDAPFGIIGIGNNLTATAESFAQLSRASGGAGNALRGMAASLMGGGGIVLAISLVTTALTVMSQKGLTVGDVFNKLTGNFDNFKKELQDVNKEAAKNAAEQVQSVKSYVSAAQDINLSMKSRLIAVQKLQDEYPAFFGNLTKEQILNGNVANAVRDVTAAIKAKARAQAYSGKLGELAEKEIPLREKETELIASQHKAIEDLRRVRERLSKEGSTDRTRTQLAAATGNLRRYNEELKVTQDAIRANISEMDKWAAKSNVEVKASIDLDFKPEKTKKPKKVKELQKQIDELGTGLKPLGLDSLIKVDAGLFKSNIGLAADMDAFIDRLRSMVSETKTVLFDWKDVIGGALGNIGTSIGEALASGGNALQAVGASLLQSIGALLSQIGDKLITVGLTAVIGASAIATMFTPAGMAAGLAAIALGTALKAGGGFASGQSKNMSQKGGGNKSVSAGNSVSSPSSSVSGGSSFSSGMQTVVFEISGQSLVGVLSNTLNKNTKLGGAMPAI